MAVSRDVKSRFGDVASHISDVAPVSGAHGAMSPRAPREASGHVARCRAMSPRGVGDVAKAAQGRPPAGRLQSLTSQKEAKKHQRSCNLIGRHGI